jgi:integrase
MTQFDLPLSDNLTAVPTDVPATLLANRHEVSIDAIDAFVLPRRRGWQASATEVTVLDLPHQPQTLAEALDLIAATGHLDATALRHIRTDLRKALLMVQRSSHESLRALPCDPQALRPLLVCVLPARHGVAAKRWSSIKASIHRVLKVSGWLATNTETEAQPSPEWQRAAEMVFPHPQRSVVNAFARFCTHQAIAPGDVTEDTLEAYRAFRLARTLDLTVSATLAQLRCILNRTGRRVPDWPVRCLAAPPDPGRIALPNDQFSPEFMADLGAYMDRLRTPDPLDPIFNKTLAPLTLKDIEGTLRRSASILVRAGIQVTSVRDVVLPENMKIVLLEGFQRLGGGGQKWASRMQTVAHWLRRTARTWVVLSPEELAQIDAMRKLVGNQTPRMSEKSRDRVAQFDDPDVLTAFFALPGEALRAADLLFKQGKLKPAARLHRTALSLALLQANPMRRQNISALEHERHFVRRGRLRYGEIRIPGTETKSGVEVRAELSAPLAERIALHIERFRPHLEAPESRFLFASSDSKPLDPRTLAQHVTRLVERQIGVRFNVHASRHLAATMLLDASAENLPVAQALLGHADSKTTARFYGAQTTRAAQGHWTRLLEARVKSTRSRAGRAKRAR